MKTKDGGNIEIDMCGNELSECEWLSFKELRSMELYSIANQVM